MTHRLSEWRILVVGAAAVALAGCMREPQTMDTTRADTPQVQLPREPAFGGADTAQRAAILEYAGQVRFVSDHALTDEQGLLLQGARGPTVRVEPVEHAHLLDDARLARGALLARFISAGDYPPLGLRRGIHYLFADRAGGSWRSIMVPEDRTQPVRVMQMAKLRVPHLIEAPIARFFESGGLTYTYIRCERTCCIPCVPLGYQCPPSIPRLELPSAGQAQIRVP